MEIRSDFALLEKNPELVYLDSVSTTLVPKIAIETVTDFLHNTVVSTRRGAHSLATKGSSIVERTRKTVSDFLDTEASQISFQKSISSSIASFAFGYDWRDNERDTIVVAESEEHSVLVTLQRVAQILNLRIKPIPIDKSGTLEIESLQNLIDRKTGIVALGTTTVGWGRTNPVKAVSQIAHDKGAIVLSDMSRSIAFDTNPLEKNEVDLAVFSGNIGLMGPPGLDIQWISQSLGTEHIPGILGGSSVANVESTEFEVALMPDKFESGIINVPAIAGLDTAINYLEKLRGKSMLEHISHLSRHLQKRLSEVSEIANYTTPDENTTVFGFNLGKEGDISCHDIALFLDELDIAVRSGLLCAHPLVKQASPEGIIQVSLHAYNTVNDIDRLVDNLQTIAKDLV